MPKKERLKLGEEEIMFLDKIVDINISLNDVVDERASILAGIGGVISVIALGQLFTSYGIASFGFLMIIITGLTTIIFSVGVIRPKQLKLRRKNLMYYGGICCFEAEEYRKRLREAMSTKENIFKEYSKEVHDLSLELDQRFKLIRKIGDILVSGLVVGFILIIISLLIR